MDYVEVPLAGKYAHLKCKLDKDWYQMLCVDGGVSFCYQIGYALIRNTIGGKELPKEGVHNIVMNFKSTTKMMIDHINGDRLDNRRQNLRIVSAQENSSFGNKRINKNSNSGIRGLNTISGRYYSVEWYLKGTRLYRKHFGTNYEDAKAVAEFHNLIRDL